jgi:MinD-like ATPase involved in chromosome partitioning or flagellar assembly
MSILLFTCGRGGAGKSTAARSLIDWYQANAIEPLLFDCDDDSASLNRHYPHSLKVKPGQRRSYDILIESAASGVHPIIIADTKAGVAGEMSKLFDDLPFDELKELDVSIVSLCVVTNSLDSIRSALRWVDFLGGKVRYVVFKNLRDSATGGEKPENVILPEYEKTKQVAEFRRLYKPIEIVLPALDSDYMGELELANLTIRAVLDRSPKTPRTLDSLLARARLRNYQNALFEQFMAHKDVFLP